MQKWADFLISAVRYENVSADFRISHVKVHSDDGSRIGGGLTWTKDEVLNAMFHGKSFLTIFRDEKGNWAKGREVILRQENGGYIITDDKSISIDHLIGVQEL